MPAAGHVHETKSDVVCRASSSGMCVMSYVGSGRHRTMLDGGAEWLAADVPDARLQ